MARPSLACLGLLLLLIGRTAAGPKPRPSSRAVRSSACQEHSVLHSRMDKVEKRVEDTVLKLEAELALLLKAIETPDWAPPPHSGKPIIDILDEPSMAGASS